MQVKNKLSSSQCLIYFDHIYHNSPYTFETYDGVSYSGDKLQVMYWLKDHQSEFHKAGRNVHVYGKKKVSSITINVRGHKTWGSLGFPTNNMQIIK